MHVTVEDYFKGYKGHTGITAAHIRNAKVLIDRVNTLLERAVASKKVRMDTNPVTKTLISGKTDEISLKAREVELKHDADIAKSMAEVRVAEIEAEAAKQVAVLEGLVNALQARVEVMSQAMQNQQAHIIIGGGRKVVTMQAPSGNVYQGVIEEENETESTLPTE